MQRWLWVTQPRFWEQLDDDGLDDGMKVHWTCDHASRRGDVALLYRTEVAKDLAHLFRIDDDELWEDVHPIDPEAHGVVLQRDAYAHPSSSSGAARAAS